jgi:hypothetical protein
MSIRKVSILGKESIHVGFSIVPYIAQTVVDQLPSSSYVLITDTNVGAHHEPTFKKEFQARIDSKGNNARFLTYFITPGESSKSRKVKETIEDFLLENACTRDTIVLALGGGVIGDLVGFVAATLYVLNASVDSLSHICQHARSALRPDSHHSARDGRFECRRKNCRRYPTRKEPRRSILATRICLHRRRVLGHPTRPRAL